MKLQKMTEKARSNKLMKSSTVEKSSGIKLTLEYRPNAEGLEGQYMGNTFYIYLQYGSDRDLIGDLYDHENGTYSMWSDNQNILVDGLTDSLHLERAHMDGNLTDNPI